MKLYNTLSRKIEEFAPLNPPNVEMYSCGPTVYDFAHIGNFRTYTLTDVLRRSLTFLGYEVKLVSNITDVGHLVSNGDTGEDKLEKGARREGKSAWEIARYYANIYEEHERLLNIRPPDVRCRATDYIQQQIQLVKKLEDKGFTYRTTDGLYFDTGKFPSYGKLTPQDKTELIAGARVEVNPEKRHPVDFALWKFSPAGKKRDMEWNSPWGIGFPGWHIECSAMAMSELGPQLDIHFGGMDLKEIHHNNEIAQSEAATGKQPFARYWVHGEFLVVDGQKMSKSKGNFYNLNHITDRGFEPLALRYLYLTAHYRSFLNFTWEGLAAAAKGLKNLRDLLHGLTSQESERTTLSTDKLNKIQDFSAMFRESIESDLQMPKALAVAWEVAKSNIPSTDKTDLLRDFDQVLGLDLFTGPTSSGQWLALSDSKIPETVLRLAQAREDARKNQDWKSADQYRNDIESAGWDIKDTPTGPKLSLTSSPPGD